MSDDRDLTRVEDLLRSVPTPSEVPPRYAPIAKAAALGGEPPCRGCRIVSARIALAAATTGGGCGVGGAVAVTLAFGVNGTRSPSTVEASVALSPGSPQFASASGKPLELGHAKGAMRPAVLKVDHLPPAPAGEYYEMWFSNGDDSVGLMAFNTEADGTVTVHSAVPTGMAVDALLGFAGARTQRQDRPATRFAVHLAVSYTQIDSPFRGCRDRRIRDQ